MNLSSLLTRTTSSERKSNQFLRWNIISLENSLGFSVFQALYSSAQLLIWLFSLVPDSLKKEIIYGAKIFCLSVSLIFFLVLVLHKESVFPWDDYSHLSLSWPFLYCFSYLSKVFIHLLFDFSLFWNFKESGKLG